MAKERIELDPKVIELLGTRPDSELAAMAGVSAWKIQNERDARGIPSYRSTLVPAPKKVKEPRFPPIDEETLALLGTLPDVYIEEMTGYTRARLGRMRRKLGIPKCNERPKQAPELPRNVIAKMGTMSDRELAKKSGFTLRQIRHAREKRGIPASWWHPELPEEVIALLGTKSDRQIAKQYGVTTFRVFNARRKRNIPAYTSKKQ